MVSQTRVELVQQVMSYDVAYFISEIAKRDAIIAEQAAIIVELRAKVSSLEQELASLKKLVFGKKSEKMPSPRSMLNGERGKSGDDVNKKKKKAQRKKHQKLSERTIIHKVEADQRQCPHCQCTDLKKVGEGKKSVVYDYVPAQVERQIHVQETLACPCGDYIVTASAPKALEGGHYGPNMMAHVVTAKCCDSLPFYRMEKQFMRQGFELSRSTLCNLFHQAANALQPLVKRIKAMVPNYDLILADETPIPILSPEKTRKGYIWTFITPDLIYYHYSASRSGETPVNIIGESTGVLVADAYSGYNQVCAPENRDRAGCWAHVRRKFFEAQGYAPFEAAYAIQQILGLYKTEYEAASENIRAGPAHLALRQNKSRPIIIAFKDWLIDQEKKQLPKSPIGKAIAYALNNWAALTLFLRNAKVPIDNNASERALRIVAIGRKNYLFAGNDEAASNLAGLYSLVASCELHEINPEKYLSDVLIKVQSHPHKDVEQLLPHVWKTIG
jgi:transposase